MKEKWRKCEKYFPEVSYYKSQVYLQIIGEQSGVVQGIGLDLVEGGRRSNFCVSVSGGEGRRVGVLHFLLFGKIFKTVFYLKIIVKLKYVAIKNVCQMIFGGKSVLV